MNDSAKDPQEHSPLAGLDLQRLMVEGLYPYTESGIDETPPEIDGYEILRPIGRGGMGQVFLARQESLDRLVAIKRIGGAGAAATTFLDRLDREAKAMARVSHPNLVEVYDFVRLKDGNAAIIMEWVAGGDLKARISPSDTRLGTKKTLTLIHPILSGLEAAHRAGIVHRDIKPENVLFASDGTAKLTDFGLSIPDGDNPRLTLTGTYVGTPGYMAPEQQAGGTTDARTDIYAVGAMLYEMLTGKLPVGNFDAPHKKNPQIPRSVSKAILACLKTDPSERPASVEHLRRLLLTKSHTTSRRSLLAASSLGVVALGTGAWQLFGNKQREADTASDIPTDNSDSSRFTILSGHWYEGPRGIESNSEIAFAAVEHQEGLVDSRIRFSFTRLSGKHSVALFFRLPNGFGSFELSSWKKNLGGVQTLDGDGLRVLPDAFYMPIENNRRYEVEMVITAENITTFVDGQKKQTQSIAGKKLGMASPWRIGLDFSEVNLALATYQSPTRWHDLSIEPL